MTTQNVFLWARRLAVVAGAFSTASGAAHATTLGQTVTNIASVDYSEFNGTRVSLVTNQVEFTIEAARTPSTIEFFRYAPSAPDAQITSVNGSDYSPSGDMKGPFQAMQAPNGAAGFIDLNNPIPLIPASLYITGEDIFVRVTDVGQNGDPNVIETVVITLVTEDGGVTTASASKAATANKDAIVLRLYESGPDTGEFFGYTPSTRDATPTYDPVLTTGSEVEMTATYVDIFDSSEVSVDTALVDPYGRVFNGATGELINGARVRLIDATTGQPAVVYGIDGVSTYPSEVITGSQVTDSSGRVYDLREGEFRFPLATLGDYYIEVDPPTGFEFASALSPSDFLGLENGPFVIETDASYGRTFTLAGSVPLNFDVPVDATTNFTVTKNTTTTSGDVGDYIRYTVTVENDGNYGGRAVIRDVLPAGFEYVEGSTRVGGQSFADPEISDTGQVLTFDLGPALVGETFELNYTLLIGSGVRPGEAVNEASAVNRSGEDVSNTARASITIREDLLRSHSTVIGRLSADACDENQQWARSIRKGTGVEGVRLYMETGAYALTDQDGLYHFEGVKPGTHVVQVDEATLP